MTRICLIHWNAWLKKGSGKSSDLTQNTVRKAAMDAGMVN